MLRASPFVLDDLAEAVQHAIVGLSSSGGTSLQLTVERGWKIN